MAHRHSTTRVCVTLLDHHLIRTHTLQPFPTFPFEFKMRTFAAILVSFLSISSLPSGVAFVVPQQNNAGAVRGVVSLRQTPTDVEALRAAAAKAREEAAALEKV